MLAAIGRKHILEMARCKALATGEILVAKYVISFRLGLGLADAFSSSAAASSVLKRGLQRQPAARATTAFLDATVSVERKGVCGEVHAQVYLSWHDEEEVMRNEMSRAVARG